MTIELNRRAALSASAAMLWTASSTRANSHAQRTMRETHVYKTVDELQIKADVFRFDDNRPRPALVWIHGGALINGNRTGLSRRIKQFAEDSGYVLISLDYRLAPETRLPEIIADIEDAFRWIHRVGAESFNIQTDRIGVAGGSAGGYLTLTAGYRVKPRPQVLLALWGYGDLIGDWYSKPSPHPRHNRRKISREEAYKEVDGAPVSDSRERKGNGGRFYQYCRQTGTWPQAVSGWNPHAAPEKFYPFMPVRNVTRSYPPTVLVHGKRDTDVPHEQSEMMVEQFNKHDVPHRFYSIPRGEHGLQGADGELVNEAYQNAFAFVRSRLAT